MINISLKALIKTLLPNIDNGHLGIKLTQTRNAVWVSIRGRIDNSNALVWDIANRGAYFIESDLDIFFDKVIEKATQHFIDKKNLFSEESYNKEKMGKNYFDDIYAC